MINKCSLYKDSEESIDYILIHCDKTRELWCFFFFLSVVFGLVCVFPSLVKNLLLQWKVKGLNKKKRVVWRLALICLFWCIWKECT